MSAAPVRKSRHWLAANAAVYSPCEPDDLAHPGYRFFFFSREERGHTSMFNTRTRRLTTAAEILREHRDEIQKAWQRHFGG
jgi:hypothetical protein